MEAPIASDKVTGNRSSMSPVTLCWYWKEYPRQGKPQCSVSRPSL